MTAPAWRRDVTDWNGIRDVTYVYEVNGQSIARAYRGGDRYYPWSVDMPGYRIGTCSSLREAKGAVERAYARGSDR